MGKDERVPYVVNRDGWPPGPWDKEPDRWEGKRAGLLILAVRNDMGSWCGYVGMPPEHPWSGYDRNTIHGLSEDLHAHGGLTFSGWSTDRIWHSAEEEKIWWIGFDCGHAWDLSPFMARMLAGMSSGFGYGDGGYGDRWTYKTIDYVKEGVRALAEQVAFARGIARKRTSN